MQIIYTTLVGSKMHGLQTPSSDEDIRHITMHPLKDIVSPFKNEKIKVQDSKGEDIESWELCHFVKHLAQGNPTMYEVIKSPLYQTDLKYAETIRSLMPYCFDARLIMLAHAGYADAQLKRYLRKADNDFLQIDPLAPVIKKEYTDSSPLLGIIKYEKDGISIWNTDHIRRIPKSVVAAYRVLAQGEQLLQFGDFQPVVKDFSKQLHDFLMEIKLMDANSITWGFIKYHLNAIEGLIKAFKSMYEQLPVHKQEAKSNIDKIEDIIFEIYKDSL